MSRTFTFREIVEAAAKPYRELWKSDGTLNSTALARYYKKKGHPVAQGTLHRLLTGKHKEVSKETADATHEVFRVPKHLLRGEPVSAELEKLLTEYKLSTLLLARRIESLPKDAYQSVVDHLESLLDREERLQAMRPHNVTPIDKSRR
jgi:hypothetical protein